MANRLERLWRSARTVRARATVTAMVLVAVVLALALIAMVLLFASQLRTSLDQTLQQQVADRARLLDAGSPPASLTTVVGEESLVWIGTSGGQQVAAGGTLIALDDPVFEPVGSIRTASLLVEERKPEETETERKELRMASAQTDDGALVVVAAAETESIEEDVARLVRLFAWALPLLTLLVGAVTWVVAGRVLGPVEVMRRDAERISGANLDARVELPEGSDELHRLGTTLNDMLDRLETHEVALRNFTADASHELKSPVANVQSLVESAEMHDPRWPALRDQLTGETGRLRGLVDNLLFLASSRDGRSPAPDTRVALDDLIFDEAEMLAATDRVNVDLSGIVPAMVHGQPDELARLVRNLADNAARHATSTVWFATETTDHAVRLLVDDNGPGVPANERTRIFERFARVDHARARDDGGTGLGLAIVAEIAHRHHATVSVTDSPHGGARFEVRFGND